MATRPAYKTDEWMETETRFRNLNDGGKIDNSILDLVIVLNLIGIRTISSCGGHFKTELEPNMLKYLERTGRPIPENQVRTDYPWVSIQVEDVWKLQRVLEEFYAWDWFHNDYELGILISGKGHAMLKNCDTLGLYCIYIHDSALDNHQKEFRIFTSWLKRRWQRLRKEIQEEGESVNI
jgi:hypothetical protein